MNLDDILSQPLSPVRDDGFSARMVIALHCTEERRRLALWSAAALALLPLLALMPMTLMARAASSPVFASAIGAVVLLWALRPARARF